MALKYKLLSQLNRSLNTLEHRKMMIPRYCDQSKHWAGENHYSMDMIPEIEFQIEEMKAAIQGIEELKKRKRKEVVHAD